VKVYPAADRQRARSNRGPIARPDFADHQAEMSVKVSFLEIQVAGKTGTGYNSSQECRQHDGGEAYVWTVREGLFDGSASFAVTTETESNEARLKDGDSVVITQNVKLVNGGSSVR